jgi:hypothetical protein
MFHKNNKYGNKEPWNFPTKGGQKGIQLEQDL